MKKNIVRAAFGMFMLTVLTTSAYPQWVQTNWPAGNSFFDLYTGQGMVFARIWDSFNGGRVFYTDNNGTSWTQLSSADSDIDILSIAIYWPVPGMVFIEARRTTYHGNLSLPPEYLRIPPSGQPLLSTTLSMPVQWEIFMNHLLTTLIHGPR